MPERPAPKPKGGGEWRTQLQEAKESSRHLAPTRAAQRWNPGNMHPERLMYPLSLLCDCGHSVPVINVHTPRRNPEKKGRKNQSCTSAARFPPSPLPPYADADACAQIAPCVQQNPSQLQACSKDPPTCMHACMHACCCGFGWKIIWWWGREGK